MHVIIGSKAVKIFIKALKFLGKYSSDYILEAIDRKLELKVVCRNQVALGIVTFDEFFFVKYEESSDKEKNKCRLSAKVLLSALKNPGKIASCTFKLDVSNDCVYLNVHKNNDIIVKNQIFLLEFDEIEDYEIPSQQEEITCQPSVFRRVLQTTKFDELRFHFQKDLMTLQSYIDYPDEDCENIRLNYNIDLSEFTDYNIKEEKAVIVSSNEFVTFLNLAQSLNMEISINFSEPGKPMITKLQSDGHYTVSLIQASLPPKSYSKRKIKNLLYEQKVLNFTEERKAMNKSRTSMPPVATPTGSALRRAIDPTIEFTEPNQISSIPDQSLQTKSSEPTYISTPSSSCAIIRANNKRKSTNEETITKDDPNATVEDLFSKRRKTHADSTVIDINTSILLSQKELNEVNDIMSNINTICDMDDDDMLPVPAHDPRNENKQLAKNSEINDIDMVDVSNTENINVNSFSDKRWPMRNSYLKNTEDTEKQKEYTEYTSHQENCHKAPINPIQEIFGHLFKPRTKIQFGRVLCPGSDSEED